MASAHRETDMGFRVNGYVLMTTGVRNAGGKEMKNRLLAELDLACCINFQKSQMLRFSRAFCQERIPRYEEAGIDRRLVTSYGISALIPSRRSGHCPASQDISLQK